MLFDKITLQWESPQNSRTSEMLFCRRTLRGDWRVTIAGSRVSENWEMRVEGPNGFERTYTPAGAAGEHEPEAIRRLIVQLVPRNSS